MKIMVEIIQHLKPGGIEKLVLDIMRLQEPEVEVYIVALEGEELACLQHWPALKSYQDRLIFLDKEPGFKLSTIKRLKKVLTNLRADIIHTHHIGPLLYGVMATLRLQSIQHIHTEHDAWHLRDNKQLQMTKLMLRLKHITLVADADTVGMQLSQVLGRGVNPVTILNGIDTEKFSPSLSHSRYKHNTRVFKIGCAARLVKEKSLDVLIKSIANIPDVELYIAGDGPEKQNLNKLVLELDLSTKVKFIGYTDDMVGFYHQLDLFVLTSSNEGLPLSILESQSCNVPVLCSDVGAVHEGVCQNTGHLIRLNTVNEFHIAIQAQMKRTSEYYPRDFITKHFDIRMMIKAYNQLIKE
ncbi:glycosyltransferase [Moritella sp. F3]|uniref:glycosyltransferase n=1 Tax=Moritella sp. F3 TaxID=2718882 RepID=UPI0018E0FA71|nr:glycosyltransferase [Moritella sp. F3]GIC79175.1 glycosyl transferase [Moritella sp. F1]GIC83475.1 glycosyl transferase [Moritella sp. F3]